MKKHSKLILSLISILICLGVLAPVFWWNSSTPVLAQAAKPNPPAAAKESKATPPAAPATNTAETVSNSATSKVETAVSPSPTNPPPPSVAGKLAPGQSPDGQPLVDAEPLSPNDEIQLSFQGANIEMVVQWLAKVTGKSVVKHPRVQCQLTIVSSKKLKARDAITLVYRALGLEGFVAVESSKSILIVPEGSEPKTGPEFIETSQTELPEGRQRLMKIFPLKNIQASELKEKIRSALSEKATIEVAERSNQLIVTDYTDNIRLIGELIKELDLPAAGDTVIEFYSLKFSEAEELGNLLTLVLNAQPGPPSSSGSRSSSSPPRNPSFPPGATPPPGASPEPSSPPSSPSAGAGPQQIRVWPDKTANRLIVAAPKAKLPEVKRLIDLLDTEKPQDVSIRVLPLKNVSADDLVRDLGPLYQKMSGKSLKDVIEVSSNSRANSLVVLSSESNFKAIEKLVLQLDTEEAQEKVMRAFPLKNAEAEDVAKQLQDLNQDTDSNSRYPFFFFSSSSMGNKGPKKPTFVADRRRNTIIVQAAPAAMDGIAKLVEELDEPIGDNSLAPKIFRLKYVSATDIEDVLNELFLKKQQQRTYWDPYGFPTRETDQQGGGRLSGKVRITSEPYSNSLIVTSNSPENLAAVEEVIKQLDAPSQAGDTTLRVTLNNAKALTVASSLNILFAKGGSPPLRPVAQNPQQGDVRQPQQQQNTTQNNFGLEQEVKEDPYFPWLGGQQEQNFGRGDGSRTASRPVSDLVGRVRVVPDKRSNSLLVTCNVHFFPQIMKLINDLDAPTSQVLIEAKIIEVSGDFRDRLGVRWSPDGSKSFDADDMDNSLQIHSGSTYKQVFAGSALADSLRTGILDTSLNLDFLVQFLRKNTDSRVLAEPQINIADNELGKLFVGSQVPFISGSLNTDVGGRNDTFQYRDVGIILEVTPHINNSEDVALKIRAESSSIRSGETLFGGAILDTRNFRTDLMLKNGQTAVLGGIIQREQVDTVRRTPGLSSVPGLGWAFKKKDRTSREVELMVFLRPWVTRTPEQAQALREEVEKKTPLIKDWESQSLENKAQKAKIPVSK